MYPNTIALARRISKSIVLFDVEHTGGAGANRAITDFGALVVTPEGQVSTYTSLVKPPPGVEFNPYVCQLTGIYPSTLENEQGWEKVLQEFVLPNKGALWVGFASRAVDIPLVYKESERVGHALDRFDQLDLLKLGTLKGSLSKRLEQLFPDFDTSGAHKAAEDALMTLMLLEALLPSITDAQLSSQRVIPSTRAPKQRRPRLTDEVLVARGKRKLDVSQFLVSPGTNRTGSRWTDDELIWACRQYRGGKQTIERMAALIGRTPSSVARALFKEEIISAEVRDTYRQA